MVLPGVSATVPLGQAVHELAPAADTKPALQGWQLVAPCPAENVPGELRLVRVRINK